MLQIFLQLHQNIKRAKWSEGRKRDDVEKVLNLFKSLVDYDSKVGLITCFAFFASPEWFLVYGMGDILVNSLQTSWKCSFLDKLSDQGWCNLFGILIHSKLSSALNTHPIFSPLCSLQQMMQNIFKHIEQRFIFGTREWETTHNENIVAYTQKLPFRRILFITEVPIQWFFSFFSCRRTHVTMNLSHIVKLKDEEKKSEASEKEIYFSRWLDSSVDLIR